MTRFARGKGSKSSNEKAPEDSTPWEVMKKQLLQSKKEKDDRKKQQEVEQQRIENYQNFLNEQKVQKRKATWCDFPDTEAKSDNTSSTKKKKKCKGELADSEAKLENTSNTKKKKKSKVFSQGKDNSETIDKNQPATIGGKKKKKNKKSCNAEVSPIKLERNHNSSELLKPKKDKFKKDDRLTETTDSASAEIDSEQKCNITPKLKDKNKKNKKKTKFVDGQPTRRKEVDDRSFQLIINGKEVELVRFDGFPIMRKDAERIQELKNNMINKGIPKSEVQRTIKLERRRAEKALARLKKDVCYNCRKGGHNLSDCPDLKSKIPGVDAADGVCFKCGSTEHKQFECKVQKNMDFKFATCFICKEAGHIARQCPDNPKGLYPNGGSCKLCGDVTHLRKDCPSVMDKKESSSLKLQTLHGDDIEGMSQTETTSMKLDTGKKPKKIKF